MITTGADAWQGENSHGWWAALTLNPGRLIYTDRNVRYPRLKKRDNSIQHKLECHTWALVESLRTVQKMSSDNFAAVAPSTTKERNKDLRLFDYCSDKKWATIRDVYASSLPSYYCSEIPYSFRTSLMIRSVITSPFSSHSFRLLIAYWRYSSLDTPNTPQSFNFFAKGMM